MLSEKKTIDVPSIRDGKSGMASETLNQMMLMMNSSDGGNMQFNEQHVSALVEQKGKIIDYIHDDRKRESFDKKFYVCVAVFAWFFSLFFTMKFAPEYLDVVIASSATFLGGLGIGRVFKRD